MSCVVQKLTNFPNLDLSKNRGFAVKTPPLYRLVAMKLARF